MNPVGRDILRYVAIGLVFGLVWAVMQYLNGQIRDIAALAVPVVFFGLAGLLMWGLRQVFLRLRGNRRR